MEEKKVPSSYLANLARTDSRTDSSFSMIHFTICTWTRSRNSSIFVWYWCWNCQVQTLSCMSVYHMSPVKRICVFEHSVTTSFNCACPAIQRGQGSGFLSEGSSWLTACMSEQWRFWRDCADAQARLNLRCSHRPDAVHMMLLFLWHNVRSWKLYNTMSHNTSLLYQCHDALHDNVVYSTLIRC